MDADVKSIKAKTVEVSEDGDTMIADLIITNDAGDWYGVDLGDGDWAYLEDNGEYIPAE